MEAVQMIWARVKLYAAATAIGFAAMWQVVVTIRKNERQDIEREQANRRVDALKAAGRIRDDVETDAYIVDRAHEWLHKGD